MCPIPIDVYGVRGVSLFSREANRPNERREPEVPKPTDAERETLTKMTSMAVMLVMVEAMETGKGPIVAADAIAEHVTELVESTLEAAQAELDKRAARIKEQDKVIAGLIKSNDEYADSLTIKVAVIKGLNEAIAERDAQLAAK